MPDANAHAEAMNTIRPSSLPRLWWLNPWATARYLHAALTAMKGYADRADKAVDIQARIIAEQSDEIKRLNLRVLELTQSRQHWIAKHEQAYAVAMHNERVIARLEDSITAGHAIVPDAREVKQ